MKLAAQYIISDANIGRLQYASCTPPSSRSLYACRRQSGLLLRGPSFVELNSLDNAIIAEGTQNSSGAI
jgi:hypothetical protein